MFNLKVQNTNEICDKCNIVTTGMENLTPMVTIQTSSKEGGKHFLQIHLSCLLSSIASQVKSQIK